MIAAFEATPGAQYSVWRGQQFRDRCPCCTVLYCAVLYCTVLYCTVLYCTVLFYTVLCRFPYLRLGEDGHGCYDPDGGILLADKALRAIQVWRCMSRRVM